MPVPHRKRPKPDQPGLQSVRGIGLDPGVPELLRGGLRPEGEGDVCEVPGQGSEQRTEAGPQCKLCDDLGYTFTVNGRGDRFATECACKADKAVQRQLLAAGLPQRYITETLDTYQPETDGHRLALGKARRYAMDWPMHHGRGLCFIGPCGTGKTHLAIAVLRHVVLTCGARAVFIKEAQLYKAMQHSYSTRDGKEADVLRPVQRAELLVLDDLGVARPTEWVVEQMESLIDERYSEGLPTIITSNYKLRPAPQALQGAAAQYGQAITPETIAQRLGGRVASRLEGMCELIPLEGGDYRRRQR